jgi:3-isopropylmalate dehydrogenase
MAGQDRANPIGTILSGAMLLRWSLGRADAAQALESAVARALDDGLRTPDLTRQDPNAGALTAVGTQGMVDAIIDRIAMAGAAPREGAVPAAARDR